MTANQRLPLLLILSWVCAPCFAAGSVNLVRNGDFSRGTQDWKVQDAIVIRDPHNLARKVLRIPIHDGTFSLSGKLSAAPSVRRVAIELAALATKASVSEPVQIRVRFYNASGDSVIVGGKVITNDNHWARVNISDAELPTSIRESVAIESNRGQGAVLIAGIRVMNIEHRQPSETAKSPGRAAPPTPGAQTALQVALETHILRETGTYADLQFVHERSNADWAWVVLRARSKKDHQPLEPTAALLHKERGSWTVVDRLDGDRLELANDPAALRKRYAQAPPELFTGTHL